MGSIICIPEQFDKLLNHFNVKPKQYYKLPDNFNNLSDDKKMEEICKRKDSYMEIKQDKHYLGEYIEELRSEYINVVKRKTTNESRLLSLKLLFIYNYFINELDDKDYNNEYFIDKYSIIEDLEHTNLTGKYNNLNENYTNYCILKDYIDKYYGKCYNGDYYLGHLNYKSYDKLDYSNLIIFIKNVEYGLMDYNKLVEIIINNCKSKKKKKLYRNDQNEINDYLKCLLADLEKYNSSNVYSDDNYLDENDDVYIYDSNNNSDNDIDEDDTINDTETDDEVIINHNN